MSYHSDYSPSRLGRIILCPGSVSLCKGVPKQPTSPYAEEGTLLHGYMELTLNAWPNDPEITFDPDKEIDHMNAIADCMDYLLKHVDLSEDGVKIFIETRVAMQGLEEVNGTLDLAVLTKTALNIFDWKFGRGVEVHAKDNPQLLSYLSGILNVFTRSGNPLPKDFPMFVHVVQPRISNFQWEEVKYADLMDHSWKAERAIRLSEGKNPPFNPGFEQCRWCDAAAVCKYRVSQTQMDVEAIYAGVADIENNRAKMEDIAELLKRKNDIEAALKQIKQFVFLELAAGGKVPGFKLVEGRSNRKWADNVTASTIMDFIDEHNFDIDSEQCLEVKLISPAKFEKHLAKKDRELLATLITKPKGALTIADENSSKPEAKVTSLEEAYAEFASSDAEE